MAIELKILQKKVEGSISQAQLDEEVDRLLSNPNIVAAYAEGEGNQRIFNIVVPSDNSIFDLAIQGISAQEYFKGKNVEQLIEDFVSGKSLGGLSEKYESNRDSSAIGEDSTGGFSYGRYQIATKTGTMKSFLNFLKNTRPDMAKELNDAGGFTAARNGDPSFKGAWRSLAANPDFPGVEHAFIRATHYDPFLRRLRGDDGDDGKIGLNLTERSFALQNVAWSTAVQHGSANSIFKNALAGEAIDDSVPQPTDETIIRKVYAERSKVDQYFSRSTEKVKQNVLDRFKKELPDALELLVPPVPV